ncbi:MAG: hypothetical protein ACFCD0_04200 [Gemmataceae bacterium]
MAFNPFSVFHKYRKFWMAAILLMTMVTFVLCAGDVQSIVGSIAGTINPYKGDKVAVVNTPNPQWYHWSRTQGVYSRDIGALKEQRNLADLFMKAATEIALDRANTHVQNLKGEMRDKKNKTKENQRELTTAVTIRSLLNERLKPERYFDTGVKLEELVDFMLWRDEARKLNINLTEERVKFEIQWNMYRREYFGGYQEDFGKAVYRVQNQASAKATPAKVMEALKQEFEVQIAKLALMGVRPLMYNPNAAPHVMDLRSVLTPEQLFTQYKKDRTSFDVALLPVDVDKFVKDVREPTEAELEKFFKKYQKKIEDPTSDTPGFTTPEKIKIQYLVADANSPYYEKVTDAFVALQRHPVGLRAIAPGGFGGFAAVVASSPAWETWVFNQYQTQREQMIRYYSLLKSYDPEPSFLTRPPVFSRRYLQDPHLQVPLGDPNFILPMYTKVRRPYPFMVASLLGNLSGSPTTVSPLAGPSHYQSSAVLAFEDIPTAEDEERVIDEHPPLIRRAIDIELGRRAPVGVTVMLSLANPTPFGLVGSYALPFAAQAHVAKAQPSNFLKLATIERPQPKQEKKKDEKVKKGPEFRDTQVRNKFLPISLPLPLVMKEFTDRYKLGLAQESVRTVMDAVQNDDDLGLADDKAKGKRGEFNARLNRIVRKYQGIVELSETTPFVSESEVELSRYEMAKPLQERDPRLVSLAKNLRKIHESFQNQKILDMINRIEGRAAGTVKHLTQDDFVKLFFDRGESFSLGNTGPFLVRAWPPTATADPRFMLMGQDLGNKNLNQKAQKGQPIDLLNAGFSGQPVVFWKSDQRGRVIPKNLDDIREKVTRAWKFQEARKKAFAEAKRVALKIEEMQQLEKDVVPEFLKQASKLKTELINLRGVSKKVPIRGIQGAIQYVPYELPKGTIPYPREDATKQILALNALTKPLQTTLAENQETKNKVKRGVDGALDQLNIDLFDKKMLDRGIKQVQVMTNKPRSRYYVALIPPNSLQSPSVIAFRDILRRNASQGEQADTYIPQARMEYNEELRKLLNQQLRDQAGLVFEEEAKERWNE